MTPDDANLSPTDDAALATETADQMSDTGSSDDSVPQPLADLEVTAPVDPEVQEARQAFETDAASASDSGEYEDVTDEVADSSLEATAVADTAPPSAEVETAEAESVESDAADASEIEPVAETTTSIEDGIADDVAEVASEVAANVSSPEQNDEQLAELATPFVGRWNELISTTNWEKGRIISDWRAALIESGVGADQYSDEAWARRVGGVTAPHVGRLRRVHDRFADNYAAYAGLYWSHFLAALDWEDAPLWLQGAVESGWSVAGMREQRWQAHGAVDSQRPTSSQIVEVETDEGVEPLAEGDAGTKNYDDDPGTAVGKSYENADFGDEEELQSLAGPSDLPDPGGLGIAPENVEETPTPVQPFAGLPELPEDLSDAIEMMKLAILRHKSNKWEKIDVEVVAKYLEAVGVLLRSP
ncbi:hypothetical protein K227x_49810 [Rubripirellula lacrimiformis]|uniref:Uncharacterized protein n=1 Tax=Rubripirellula lacrimiformis TaxID=1930273 RepID=A0A517NHF4_9BACT|nr:hypothetical protein [Rubripirellula lacrimiformis]QDT06571.1 hypothetical protein K227x_49810 [Rubripirellula lacrimiformis]